MMTRYPPRVNITGKPFRHCHKRTKNRNSAIHSIWGVLFRLLFLSVLPQKNFTNNRTGTNMTPDIYYFIQPDEDPPIKHDPSPLIRSLCNMSTPRHNKKNERQGRKSPCINYHTRNSLYPISRIRIRRSSFLHVRFSFRLNLFHSYRIPWPSRHYRIYLPNSILIPIPETKRI